MGGAPESATAILRDTIGPSKYVTVSFLEKEMAEKRPRPMGLPVLSRISEGLIMKRVYHGSCMSYRCHTLSTSLPTFDGTIRHMVPSGSIRRSLMFLWVEVLCQLGAWSHAGELADEEGCSAGGMGLGGGSSAGGG